MKVGEVYGGSTLKSEDLDGDTTVTMTEVKVSKFKKDGGGDEEKIVICLKDQKDFVCNKTNAKTIAKLHGDETDGWIGKQITLYATEVEFQGDTVMAIRVRLKAPLKRPQAKAE